MRALDALRDRLRIELDVGQAVHAIEWGNPRVMTESLKRIRHEIAGGGNDKPADDQVQAAILRFAANASALSFTELKYLCYGSTVPVGKDQWRVIDRAQLFNALLELVQRKTKDPKQFRRCYQGLLSGYFGFERDLDEPGSAEQRWLQLREFLAEQLTPLRRACAERGQSPDWLTVLYEHRNLLTEDPCSRYAAALERGDQSELRTACAGLGIPSNSWVWVEAMMAYVKLVCQGSDEAFKSKMDAVLDLVNGATSVTLPSALSVMATAMVVTRYSRCLVHPEHAGLRDTCVQWIGNPWVKRIAWDVAVNHEPARLMVNSWLKQRLIRDFFELLAADGAADLRRLNYWLKWEPHISDMWFVLGSDAASNKSAAFLELRKRMAGRDRRLQDSNALNNAFVMRIGPLLVIEFGATGNACYIFAASDFKANLDKRFFSLPELKQKIGWAVRPLGHMGANWEGKFDYEIRRLLNRIPESRGVLAAAQELASSIQSVVTHMQALPVVERAEEALPAQGITNTANQAPRVWPFARMSSGEDSVGEEPTSDRLDQSVASLTEGSAGTVVKSSPSSSDAMNELIWLRLQGLLEAAGVEWEDNRPKGGALWVLITDPNKHPRVVSVLEKQKFRFAPGKGYWLKS